MVEKVNKPTDEQVKELWDKCGAIALMEYLEEEGFEISRSV